MNFITSWHNGIHRTKFCLRPIPTQRPGYEVKVIKLDILYKCQSFSFLYGKDSDEFHWHGICYGDTVDLKFGLGPPLLLCLAFEVTVMDFQSQGLEVMIFGVILGLGKRDICFKMSEVRLFKNLKKSSNRV